MIELESSRRHLAVCLLLVVVLAQVCPSQSSSALLRLQHSKAYLEIDSHVQHAQGFAGITTGNPGDVWHYPNSVSCLVVFEDGKYAIEKREEATLGNPKIKGAEGTLSSDEMQELKAILNDEALQKAVSPPVRDLPEDTVALREIESVDAQIERTGTIQHFTTLKRRVKTTAGSGMDISLDDSSPLRKTLQPLMKWFDGLEKKAKSNLKDAKPQLCAPLNVG